MKKYIFLLPFILGVCCFIISGIYNTGITSDGFLIEPFFFLIPTGYIFFLIGIIISISKFSYFFYKKIKKA